MNMDFFGNGSPFLRENKNLNEQFPQNVNPSMSMRLQMNPNSHRNVNPQYIHTLPVQGNTQQHAPLISEELNESFFQSLHEDFLESKLESTLMNYSLTNAFKENSLSSRRSALKSRSNTTLLKHIESSDEDMMQLSKRSQMVLTQFESVVEEQENSFGNFQEGIMTQWKQLAINKIEFYKNELANILQETEMHRQEQEALIFFYKGKLEEHLLQCCNQDEYSENEDNGRSWQNEEIQRLGSLLEQKEEEFGEMVRKYEVASAVDMIVRNMEEECSARQWQKQVQQLEEKCEALNQTIMILHKEKEDMKRNFLEERLMLTNQIKEIGANSSERIEELSKKNLQLEMELKVSREQEEAVQTEVVKLKGNEIFMRQESDQLTNIISNLKVQLSEIQERIKETEQLRIVSETAQAEKQREQLVTELKQVAEQRQQMNEGFSEITKIIGGEKVEDWRSLIQNLQKQTDSKNEIIIKLKKSLFQRNQMLKQHGISPLNQLARKPQVDLEKEKDKENCMPIDNQNVSEGHQKDASVTHHIQHLRKPASKTLSGGIYHVNQSLQNDTQDESISIQHQNQSMCLEGQQLNASCVQEKVEDNASTLGGYLQPHKRRAASLSAMPNDNERNQLIAAKRQTDKRREALKFQIAQFMTKFNETNGRDIQSGIDQKPIKHLLKELKDLKVSSSELEARIKSIELSNNNTIGGDMLIHNSNNNNMFNNNSLTNESIINNNTLINNHTINNNTLSSNIGHNQSSRFVDQSISDISTNASCVRQPIFKNSNPLFPKHLGFINSQFSTLEHNQQTLLHNISNQLADSSQILSASTAAVSSHKNDTDSIIGLRLEIKNLQQDNNVLREKLLNSKALHEYQKEIKLKETRIEELLAEIAELTQTAQHQSQQIAEQTETITVLSSKLNTETKERKLLHNLVEDMKGKIRVFCRVRPPSDNEINIGTSNIVELQDDLTLSLITRNGPKKFAYDACYGFNSTQEEIFEDAKKLIQSAVDGYNVCIFAYGQTGSGKTFTMQGTRESPGITPRSIAELYHLLKPIRKTCKVTISASLIELYMDTIIDLLAPPRDASSKKLEIKEDISTNTTYIQNATVANANNKEELEKLIKVGIQNRKVSKTEMNTESSRSHLIISIILSIYNPLTEITTNSKINLIDLAGSERIHKSNANPLQVKEVKAINKSLTALGDVISALTTQEGADKFIPYRNNKLTYLMKDSLGGNAKTLMFVNVSPSEYNQEETQSSLQYASRVKTIVNEAIRNIDTKELTRLKEKLQKTYSENEKLHAYISQDNPMTSHKVSPSESQSTLHKPQYIFTSSSSNNMNSKYIQPEDQSSSHSLPHPPPYKPSTLVNQALRLPPNQPTLGLGSLAKQIPFQSAIQQQQAQQVIIQNPKVHQINPNVNNSAQIQFSNNTSRFASVPKANSSNIQSRPLLSDFSKERI